MLRESYDVLHRLRLPREVYLASPSKSYRYVWIRDCVYMSMPYLDKFNRQYEKTYYSLLDMFSDYEWKIDICCHHKPKWEWEYIHARYSQELREIHSEPWGHVQHDMIGAFLYGMGCGLREGKPMLRSEQDHRIVQKLVRYLENVEYWHDPDNGMWEEQRELHASSVGACVAGLAAISPYVNVPKSLSLRGIQSLFELYPKESPEREVDLAQLSLIYPYRLFGGALAEQIINRVEQRLLRPRGVIRYEGDSYYSTLEETDGRGNPPEHYLGTEAEWTFGLPWLALCRIETGNIETAAKYLERTESLMTRPGELPESYYSSTTTPNPNSPLGWSSAMYILAKERLTRETRDGSKNNRIVE